MSALSIPTLACLIPNRCTFASGIKCLDYAYEAGNEEITLKLRLRTQGLYNNLNLKTDSCQQIDRAVNDSKIIDFILKCKPSKSDYSYPIDVFPKFLDPCPSRISYRKDIGLFDNENLIAKGELITYVDPPPYFNSLNVQRNSINFLFGLLPSIIISITIYFLVID